MKRLFPLLLLTALFLALPASQAAPRKKDLRTVVFATDMHCHNCVEKLTENLSFAKGVKDLAISLEQQRITITYDPAKTDEKTLAALIGRLGYKAEACTPSSREPVASSTP